MKTMWSVQYFIKGLIPPSFENTKDTDHISNYNKNGTVQAQKSKSTEQTAAFCGDHKDV